MPTNVNRMSEGQLIRWLALQANEINIEQGNSGVCSMSAALYHADEAFYAWSVSKHGEDFGDVLRDVCREVKEHVES